MVRKILLAFLVVVVLIQFIRPEKNLSDNNEHSLMARYEVPAAVDGMLRNACNDCHSNRTEYPWYADVQPVSWWLDKHVRDGKRHLNFSAFTHLPVAVQNHKFEEIVETVEEGEMPLHSYTWLGLHDKARLSDEERTVIVNWARSQMELLKSQYPADSLKMKPRKKQS
jgi:hypothetical protein